MAQYYTVPTRVGAAKLANAIALGVPIEIVEMAVGDGGGNLPDPDSSRSSLINEQRRAPINASETDPDNPTWIVIEQIVPPEVGGWTIREVGVFDTDGDMIAYGNYPETYKPLLSEGSGRTQTIRFVLQVSDTAAVTLKVDPSIVLATRGYVNDELDKHTKARSHPAATTTAQGMVELATPTETRTGNDSQRAVTPAGNKVALDEHRRETDAHSADRISLGDLPNLGNPQTVQAALAAMGNVVLRDQGPGNGLDADTLDGQHGSYYRNAGNLNAGTLPRARLSGSYNIDIDGAAASANNSSQLGGQPGGYYRNAGNLNAGTVPRARLSGTYDINITGNADTLDGQHGGYYRNASNLNAGTVPAARLPNSVKVTTSSVLNATKGASVGAVGTYAFLHSSRDLSVGATTAASNLEYADASGGEGNRPSGTWRAMGQPYGSSPNTLFLRIS
ncbi:phage tail protein [Salinicola avicenniae]|uniref:phage tail protein n=1 Tax=Salinicola avicenniae TaxID=2916836 RepID=UPI002072A4EB|nr:MULTISPECIES: phage tail protein [unclassified Salinicola]